LSAPAQEALLAVQDLDTALDQHRHRRGQLPQRQELVALDAELRELASGIAAAAERRDVVAARQSQVEAELDATQARVAEISGRLYGGTVSASRDLQAMATEIEHLQARAATLEDAVLAEMEASEPLDAEVDALEASRAARVAARTLLAERLAVAEAEVDAEIAALVERRGAAAVAVAPELLGTYEQLRGRLDGVGAARLVGAMCSGCHLALPATEIDRIKRAAPDEIVLCDQCGRILVRA